MILNKELIGKKFIDCSFDNFNIIRGTEKAVWACKEFVSGLVRGIVLVSPPGRGKTHLLVAMIRACDKKREVEIDDKQTAVVIESGAKIVFWPHKELVTRLRAEVIGGNRDILESCKTADMLAIDDFGSEKPTEFIVEALEEILDWRYRNELRTAITTNLSGKAIDDIYGPRITSRWIEEYLLVEISTEQDYRLRIAAERRKG